MAGEQILLRGKVVFEWRAKGAVVRKRIMRTRAGHRSSAGADPVGYSAATCQIS